MGRRGPKPVDFGLLSVWEFEFYKAFHLLRDGTALPVRQRPPLSGLTPREAVSFIVTLKRMSPADYWLTTNRMAIELGQHLDPNRPPTSVDLWWAESQQSQEVSWLKGLLRPPRLEPQSAGKKVWRALIQANTYADVRKACGRWARLPSVRRAGLTPFPEHVRTNAMQFLAMKKNSRFPKSAYGDDSRIEFLARGMAGIMVNLSPMTGIERLRNIKHAPGGPLWVEREGNSLLPRDQQRCGCWRCGLDEGNELAKLTQSAYENGLRRFIEIGAGTKAPKEWATRLRGGPAMRT